MHSTGAAGGDTGGADGIDDSSGAFAPALNPTAERGVIPGYHTVRQIGVGAGSTIMEVIRIGTGERFAVKCVVKRGPDDIRFLQQTETEYEVSSKARHESLRRSFALHRVKKWFRVRGLLLLMEYVEGEPLEAHRPDDPACFFPIFGRVVEGLAALHQSGFVHADIKPNNILVNEDQLVKIIDFGQSCAIGYKKERVQGTPDFIAPEQVRRLTLDRRTDVFNLGATMYWALTGVPFPTVLRRDTGRGPDLVNAENVQSPRETDGRIPAALSQLVMDCCRNNPNDRPADMTLVARRLQAVETAWRKEQSVVGRSGPMADGQSSTPSDEAT